MIVLGFVALAGYLYREGRLFTAESLSVVGAVFAYFLGVFARWLRDLWHRWRGPGTSHWWEDAKALVTLGVVALTAGLYLAGRADLVPSQLANGTLAAVLFYFGSR